MYFHFLDSGPPKRCGEGGTEHQVTLEHLGYELDAPLTMVF